MGWTEIYATHFYDNGSVNRKAECDAYFLESLNSGHYKVVKSTMKGSVYYGAITPLKRPVKDAVGNYVYDANGWYTYENVPENELETFGVVILTYVKNSRSFGYKIISETSGPYYYDCPATILNALTPTDNAYAQEWREKCFANISMPKLSKLPIGTQISFNVNGTPVELRKSKPMYQFKTPFWINDANNTYYSKKRIPKDFTIIALPTP